MVVCCLLHTCKCIKQFVCIHSKSTVHSLRQQPMFAMLSRKTCPCSQCSEMMRVTLALACRSQLQSLQQTGHQLFNTCYPRPQSLQKDKQLWLHLLPLVDTLLGSHAVRPSALHLLALCMRQAGLPVLGSTQAVKGPPSLPLALTNHADAAFMFSEAQQQLSDIEVTQVSWLCCRDASMLLSKSTYIGCDLQSANKWSC